MRIIFATGNKGKLAEASAILGPNYELVSPLSLGLDTEAEETADSLEGNSFLKANYVYERLGGPCFADDTGLEIDALGGAPGVYTARYAGPNCNFDDNMDKVLRELEGVPLEKRTARFRCVVTLLMDEKKWVFDGCLEGKIDLQKSGVKGFGYDPIFIANQYPDKTLAQLAEGLKNSISHRFQALDAMRKVLEAL